jgi:hypothetical protein
MTRPSLFVGSSSENLNWARAIQVLLDPICEVQLWTQGVFGLMQGTLESLVQALPEFDFAVLVLSSDDLLVSRGAQRQVARDNVLFELGLFVGALGRERTFMVYDRTNPPSLPSDLAGVVAATFCPPAAGNYEAALGAACTRIQNAIERLGVRENKGFDKLAEATASVEGVSASVHNWLRLLIRSRKLEFDIVSSQFAPFIEPSRLDQMRQDLADLENSLTQEVTSP